MRWISLLFIRHILNANHEKNLPYEQWKLVLPCASAHSDPILRYSHNESMALVEALVWTAKSLTRLHRRILIEVLPDHTWYKEQFSGSRRAWHDAKIMDCAHRNNTSFKYHHTIYRQFYHSKEIIDVKMYIKPNDAIYFYLSEVCSNLFTNKSYFHLPATEKNSNPNPQIHVVYLLASLKI